MSAFSDAIAEGLDTIADAAGEQVRYWRGTTFVTIDNAVPGSSQQRIDDLDSGAAAIASRSADWIFSVAELVINGQAITPKRGDLVKWTVGTTTRIFEVDSDTDELYRFSDRARSRIRVHTKERPST